MTIFTEQKIENMLSLGIQSMKKNGVNGTNFTKLQSQVGVKRSEIKNLYFNKESFIRSCTAAYLDTLVKQLEAIASTNKNPLEKLRAFIDYLYLHCQDNYHFCPIYDALKVYTRERLDRDDRYDMSSDEIELYYGFQAQFQYYCRDFEQAIKDITKKLVNAYVSEVKGKASTSPTYSKPIIESLIAEFKDKNKDRTREFFQVYEHLNKLVDKYNNGAQDQPIRPPSTLTIADSTKANTGISELDTAQTTLKKDIKEQLLSSQYDTIQQKLSAYPLPEILLDDAINSQRALSMNQVIQNNIERRDYDYKDLPVGDIDVRLDLKLWGKHSNLQLYFTEIMTGKKYSLAVFKPFDADANDGYYDRDKNIDFSKPNINGSLYRFNIKKTAKGYFNLMSAIEIK